MIMGNNLYPSVGLTNRTIKKLVIDENEVKSSHEWFEIVGSKFNILDPDAWRSLEIDYDTMIPFDTFFDAVNGGIFLSNITFFNDDGTQDRLIANKVDHLWYVVTYRNVTIKTLCCCMC